MKRIPYCNNPGNACALACYTMAAQYLLPSENITFEKLGTIAGWGMSYVVWPFSVWTWLMDKGLSVIDYDIIDYASWSTSGFKSLKTSLPGSLYNFYRKNTRDVTATGQQIELLLNHKNFTYIHKSPTWEDVLSEFNKPGVCDITVNSNTLNNTPGFTIHRVVLLDITNREVIFHDPNKDGSGAYRHEPLPHFKAAFNDAEGPELTRYSI